LYTSLPVGGTEMCESCVSAAVPDSRVESVRVWLNSYSNCFRRLYSIVSLTCTLFSVIMFRFSRYSGTYMPISTSRNNR